MTQLTASIELGEQEAYAILTKTECVFAAYWQDSQGVVNTTDVARFFEVEIEQICGVLEHHGDEFEIVDDGWTPRQTIHLGMLLDCPIAKKVRSLALDVIEAHKNKSKRDAVTFLLKNTEFVRWSDREIARILKCHHSTVGASRKELEESGKILKFEKRSFNRNGKQIEQLATKESSGGFSQMHPSNPDSFVDNRTPKTYAEEEVQVLIAQAIQEAKIGFGVEIEEVALNNVREQLEAQATAAKSWKEEAVKLRSRLDEMEGLRRLEVENEQLRLRIKELERAVQERPTQEWGNTFTKQAQKIINKDIQKILENVDPDLDLRTLANSPPPRERYREVRSLFEKAAYMLEIVPLAGRRCIRGGRYGTIADINDETHLAEIDWDYRLPTDSAGDLYALNEIKVLPTLEGISEGSWVAGATPGQATYNYRGLVKEVRPKEKEIVVCWHESGKTAAYSVDCLRLIRFTEVDF